MKTTIVSSTKYDITKGLLIYIILLFLFIKIPFKHITEIIILIAVESIIMWAYLLFLLKGRKIEIDDYGINIGKRYLGPYNSPSEIKALKIPSFRKQDLFLRWEEIEKIHVGTWSSFLVRYNNIILPLLAGEKISNKEKMGLLFNMPVTRAKSYFLVIVTKKLKIYAIDITRVRLEKVKTAIESLGKVEVLDTDEYKVRGY